MPSTEQSFSKLGLYIESLLNDTNEPTSDRLAVLDKLADYIIQKGQEAALVNLLFICTHNSRRSQFSQVWAQVAAHYYKITNINSLSGGTEVTALNPRTAAALERIGFHINKTGGDNPRYSIYYAINAQPTVGFSKTFDDPTNKTDRFAAIMTCSHADDNCPFIPGAEIRIPLNYEDPKAFDDTGKEEEAYDSTCKLIANELFYVMRKVASHEG